MSVAVRVRTGLLATLALASALMLWVRLRPTFDESELNGARERLSSAAQSLRENGCRENTTSTVHELVSEGGALHQCIDTLSNPNYLPLYVEAVGIADIPAQEHVRALDASERQGLLDVLVDRCPLRLHLDAARQATCTPFDPSRSDVARALRTLTAGTLLLSEANPIDEEALSLLSHHLLSLRALERGAPSFANSLGASSASLPAWLTWMNRLGRAASLSTDAARELRDAVAGMGLAPGELHAALEASLLARYESDADAVGPWSLRAPDRELLTMALDNELENLNDWCPVEAETQECVEQSGDGRVPDFAPLSVFGPRHTRDQDVAHFRGYVRAEFRYLLTTRQNESNLRQLALLLARVATERAQGRCPPVESLADSESAIARLEASDDGYKVVALNADGSESFTFPFLCHVAETAPEL